MDAAQIATWAADAVLVVAVVVYVQALRRAERKLDAAHRALALAVVDLRIASQRGGSTHSSPTHDGDGLGAERAGGDAGGW